MGAADWLCHCEESHLSLLLEIQWFWFHACRLPQLALCACYSKPWHAEPRWRFTVSITQLEHTALWFSQSIKAWIHSATLVSQGRRLSVTAERWSQQLGCSSDVEPSCDQQCSFVKQVYDQCQMSTLVSCMQMKPADELGSTNKYVRSMLVVPESGQAALFSRKISFSVFRLQFVLGYNWKSRTPSLDYR